METTRRRSRLWLEFHAMRLRNQSRMMAWDALARVQSQQELEASFVRWESADQPASRRIASVGHPRYLCHYCHPAVIEPKYGFVIADPGTLIETSVSNAYVVRDPGLRHLSGFPSPASYLARRYVRRDWAEVGPVISLATLWPGNYFHFYRDVLPKFLLLEESAVDASLPIVVPDYLLGQPFFQDAIRSKRLGQWQFISPQGRFLRCEEVVFCSDHQWTMPYLQKRPLDTTSTSGDPSATGWTLLDDLDQVLALLDLEASEADTKEERRVFVTRSPTRERSLLNFEEISCVLDDNGFEIIDTEGWSLAEQARLFRQSRYVIALHGAGCVNLIYSAGRNCDLLEIRPPGEEGFESDFGYLCRTLGVGHHQIFGERRSDRVSRSDSFAVNASALADAIDGVLSPLERRSE